VDVASHGSETGKKDKHSEFSEEHLSTYTESTLPKYNYVHVQRLKVRWAVRILVETTETDEVIISEQLNFLASFFHENIFCRQRVNGKDLWRSRIQWSVHSV
jgi:hypothetical protein